MIISLINKIIELSGVILFSVTLSPQIIKIINTKKMDDISTSFLILNVFSSILLGYSAVINNNPEFIVVNTMAIIQTTILLFLKYYYKNYQYYDTISDI